MNIFIPLVMIAAVLGFCGQFGKNTAPAVEDKPVANRPVKQAPDRDAVKKQLVELANEIANAAKDGDVTYLAKVTTDDFQLTDVDGKVQNKNKALADVKEEKAIRSFDISDEQLVSLDEDSAVLSYTIKVTAKNGRSAKAKTIDNYVRSDGKWLLKSEQQTLIK
jgi:hypothetical protein